MIELHRLPNKVPRAIVIRNVALVAGGFLVLAGSGVGLAWFQRDGSVIELVSKVKKQDATSFDVPERKQRENITKPTDEENTTQTGEVQSASTALQSSNVVRPTETTALIADHAALFANALGLLKTYEQHIASGTNSRYIEATNMKGSLDLAISKTTATAIGSDSRAAYSSTVMLAVGNISTLMSDAASDYAEALYAYANASDGSAKLRAGQQKAASAQAAYAAMPQ